MPIHTHTHIHYNHDDRGLQLRVVGAAVVAASVRSLLECPIGPSFTAR